MPGADPFSYAILRAVPRPERGESLNVGVVLFCRRRSYLALRCELDRERLTALHPSCDPAPLEAHLRAAGLVAAGDPAGGAVAGLEASERFGWLVAPASTVLQASPVHTGLTDDPGATLERLFGRLVG